MHVYSWDELNEVMTQYLHAIAKDTGKDDAVWRETVKKISNITLSHNEYGYVLFDEAMANVIIEQHQLGKYK